MKTIFPNSTKSNVEINTLAGLEGNGNASNATDTEEVQSKK